MRPSTFRIPLYTALWLFSVLLLSLTAARIDYTTHLPQGDPLNNHVDFYDPIVVELLVCAILALGFGLFVFPIADRFLPDVFLEIRSSIAELIALSVLWLLWLVGVAVSTAIWPNLSFCAMFAACQILSAMLAFSWLGWITLTCLLAVSITEFAQRGRAAAEPATVEWAMPVSFGPPASYMSFDPPSSYAPSVRTERTSQISRGASMRTERMPPSREHSVRTERMSPTRGPSMRTERMSPSREPSMRTERMSASRGPSMRIPPPSRGPSMRTDRMPPSRGPYMRTDRAPQL